MNCKWVLPTSKYTTHMPFFTKGYCYVLCCHFKGFDFPGNYSFILQELHRRVILCCINSWCSNEGCDHMSPFSMSLSCCRSCSSHGLQERVLMIFCKLYCRDMKGMGRLLPLLRLWFWTGLAIILRDLHLNRSFHRVGRAFLLHSLLWCCWRPWLVSVDCVEDQLGWPQHKSYGIWNLKSYQAITLNHMPKKPAWSYEVFIEENGVWWLQYSFSGCE